MDQIDQKSYIEACCIKYKQQARAEGEGRLTLSEYDFVSWFSWLVNKASIFPRRLVIKGDGHLFQIEKVIAPWKGELSTKRRYGEW